MAYLEKKRKHLHGKWSKEDNYMEGTSKMMMEGGGRAKAKSAATTEPKAQPQPE
jgi:hypothetical protein